MGPFIFSLFVALAGPFLLTKEPTKALCIVPVADLISQHWPTRSYQTVIERYKALPLSEKKPITLCCRATQLLYNELVTIIEQRNGQSYVETTFWHKKTTSLKSFSTKNNRFWTLSNNLYPVSSLSSKQQSAVPELSSLPSIVLCTPWTCPQTHITYSTGTRFAVTQETTQLYRAKLLMPDGTVTEYAIPKKQCLAHKKRTSKEQRDLFVHLVQTWAKKLPGRVPYVLGGCSVGQTISDLHFIERTSSYAGRTVTSFVYPALMTTPCTGLDCSGLIRRACSIAEIPMSALNSLSLATVLSPLQSHETVQNGDIIYWKGHVAVITDTKKGLLAEARGYDHGYGYVHEIPFHEQLKGIMTTDDLVTAFRTKKQVQRLDKAGVTREIITDLTIFSLFPN